MLICVSASHKLGSCAGSLVVRQVIIQSLFLLVLASICLARFQEKEGGHLFDEGLSDYTGRIGRTAVQMTLVSDGDNQIRGSYFYKQHLEDISLQGRYLGPRDIFLKEHGAQGRVIATFQLTAAEHDPRFASREPLEGEVLTGVWRSADGKRSLPVYLRLKDILTGVHDLRRRYAGAGAGSDSEVERNAQAFYFAVLSGHKQKAANYVRYPLLVNFPGGSRTIRNKPEFLKGFEDIFTHRNVECLAKSIPHDMFANYQGVMLGSGLVWFDETGHAETLNLCAADGKQR